MLIQQLDPFGFHLGTDMHFGNDGYLYISLGDGGDQNDSRRYGQRIDLDFHCALLRIDVDKLPGNPEPNVHPSVPRDGGIARYSIPADNPFVTANPNVVFNGVSIPAANVRTEFFSTGLRNPFRFSIDALTGEIWVGDVGQLQREEINLATNGANFGWSWREGTLPGPNTAEALPGFTYTDPLYEYVARRYGQMRRAAASPVASCIVAQVCRISPAPTSSATISRWQSLDAATEWGASECRSASRARPISLLFTPIPRMAMS